MTRESKLQELRTGLKSKFLERDELVDGMITALLSKEMLFMLGPPGTAKSAICESLCNSIKGNYFSWLVSKFTTPEEIFGPLSLKALEDDKYERVVDGKLPEANVAFLDEIFKGSSAILNTLLPVINERTFYNGTSPVKIPLQVMFGASNEIPQAEELAALYDRFALRYVVDRMKTDSSVTQLFKDGINEDKLPEISEQDLRLEQKAAAAVTVSDEVVKILVKLRREMNETGIYVSDRKWMQSIRVIKAFAHLNGNTAVDGEDIDILNHMLWSTPEQQATVRKVVSKHTNPLGEKILQITDGITEVVRLCEKNQLEPVEAHKKAKAAIKTLEKLQKDQPKDKKNRKLDEALVRVKQINRRILKEHLGLEDMFENEV